METDEHTSESAESATPLVPIDEAGCLRLMRGCAIGRLAVVADGRPLVFPVNFALDGRAVVLRTAEGTKVHAARRGWVAFECDGADGMYHTGWSVLISGRAEEVQSPGELARLQRLPLGPWLPGPKPIWLRIRPRTITGRRILPHGTKEQVST